MNETDGSDGIQQFEQVQVMVRRQKHRDMVVPWVLREPQYISMLGELVTIGSSRALIYRAPECSNFLNAQCTTC